MATIDIALPGPRRTVGLRSLVAPSLAALIGVAILVSLGVWQLRRLTWKEGLLADIAARARTVAVALPEPAQWPALVPQAYEYRHVRLQGVFENDKEALLFAPGDPAASEDSPAGAPGYLVLTPLRLADGSHVIVNRGFVPLDRKDPASRAAGQIAGPTTLTGLMRSPEPRNWFTPADDPAHDLWFTRDAASIAAYFHLTRPAPFTVDADARPAAPGMPHGGATAINIPNNHFSYAVTWFGLALALVCVWGSFCLRALRGS